MLIISSFSLLSTKCAHRRATFSTSLRETCANRSRSEAEPSKPRSGFIKRHAWCNVCIRKWFPSATDTLNISRHGDDSPVSSNGWERSRDPTRCVQQNDDCRHLKKNLNDVVVHQTRNYIDIILHTRNKTVFEINHDLKWDRSKIRGNISSPNCQH